MPFEGFKCECCGHCCLNLTDVCETECTAEDYERWEAEERYDILEWVWPVEVDGRIVGGDIWISPKTDEFVSRCPWLRKMPNQNKYKCRIHDTKPARCRDYPHNLEKGVTTRCPVCVRLERKKSTM